MKCLYLVPRSLDPTGRGRAKWLVRWKLALNAFANTFEAASHPAPLMTPAGLRYISFGQSPTAPR